MCIFHQSINSSNNLSNQRLMHEGHEHIIPFGVISFYNKIYPFQHKFDFFFFLHWRQFFSKFFYQEMANKVIKCAITFKQDGLGGWRCDHRIGLTFFFIGDWGAIHWKNLGSNVCLSIAVISLVEHWQLSVSIHTKPVLSIVYWDEICDQFFICLADVSRPFLSLFVCVLHGG